MACTVKARVNVYHQVARLHADNLDQSFLATLGTGFLAELYRAIDLCPQAVLIVKGEPGKVVGFVAGLAGPMSVVYRRMLWRLPLWGWRLVPVLFSPARLKRVAEILRYTNSEPAHGDFPTAELLSIAVAPAARGTGVAESLYVELSNYFRQMKVATFKIVVGEKLLAAHKFYERMGARWTTELELHQGAKSVVYVQTVTQ